MMDAYSDQRGDGGEQAMPHANSPSSSTVAIHSANTPAASSSTSPMPFPFAIPKLPGVSEIAERQRIQFPFVEPPRNDANTQPAVPPFFVKSPGRSAFFSQPLQFHDPANSAQPAVASTNPSNSRQAPRNPTQSDQLQQQQHDVSYSLPSPSDVLESPRALPTPPPRGKSELLSAARSKLKEVRGEERDISTAYLVAVEGRDMVSKAIAEGIPSLADRVERVRASVAAIRSATGLLSAQQQNLLASGHQPPTNAPPTAGTKQYIQQQHPMNYIANLVSSLDAPPCESIAAALASQLESLEKHITALQSESQALKTLKDETLNPLEVSVAEAERLYAQWTLVQSRYEAEVTAVRSTIHDQLKDIKALETWMREWVFDSALLSVGNTAAAAQHSSSSAIVITSPEGYTYPPTLAALLGCGKQQQSPSSPSTAHGTHSNNNNHLAKRREELLSALAVLDEQTKAVQSFISSHEDALVTAELEDEVKMNKQLLASYKIRINSLEKERRKRPRRSEVGARLLMVKEQAAHLRSEYQRQREELRLLENRPLETPPPADGSSTAGSSLTAVSAADGRRPMSASALIEGASPIYAGIRDEADGLDSTLSSEVHDGIGSGSSSDATDSSDASASTTSSTEGRREARRQRRHEARVLASSPIKIVSRHQTPSTTTATGGGRHVSAHLSSSSAAATAAASALGNVDANGPSSFGSSSTTTVVNRLQARCKELQYALSTYRDVTLPDLRRAHGELKGAVFDANVLLPEAWEAEERRHKLHIAAMSSERDALKAKIRETSALITSLQAEVQQKAAEKSSKTAKARATIAGRLTGTLFSTASGIGGLFGRGQTKAQPNAIVEQKHSAVAPTPAMAQQQPNGSGSNAQRPSTTISGTFEDLPSILRSPLEPAPPTHAFASPPQQQQPIGRDVNPSLVGAVPPTERALDLVEGSEPKVNVATAAANTASAADASLPPPPPPSISRNEAPHHIVRDKINGVEEKLPPMSTPVAVFVSPARGGVVVGDKTAPSDVFRQIQFYDISAANAKANMSLVLDASQCHSRCAVAGSFMRNSSAAANHEMNDQSLANASTNGEWGAAPHVPRLVIIAEAPRPQGLKASNIIKVSLAAPSMKHLPKREKKNGGGGGGTAVRGGTAAVSDASSTVDISKTTSAVTGTASPYVVASPSLQSLAAANTAPTASVPPHGVSPNADDRAQSHITTAAPTVATLAQKPPLNNAKEENSSIGGGGLPAEKGGSLFYRIASMPVAALSLPYTAARHGIKAFIAPPSVSSKTREEMRLAVAQRAAAAQQVVKESVGAAAANTSSGSHHNLSSVAAGAATPSLHKDFNSSSSATDAVASTPSPSDLTVAALHCLAVSAESHRHIVNL